MRAVSGSQIQSGIDGTSRGAGRVRLNASVFLCVLVAAASAVAQVDSSPADSAPADSSAAGLSPSLADSLLPVAADSLKNALAAINDSLITTADSTAASSLSLGPGDSLRVEPWPVESWVASAALGDDELEELRPRLLAEALDALPGVAVRVAGDHGAPGYLSLGPIADTGTELLVDGIPSLNPADLDPAIFDRSIAGVGALEAGRASGTSSAGGPSIRIAPHAPAEGRTVLRTHFTDENHESFVRGVSLTTPHARQSVRFDFEEWKTEDGFNFTQNVSNDGLPNNLGRSKMRRFRVALGAQLDRGRATVAFGRGRRFYRGSVLGSRSVERWTGEVSASVDRADASGQWRARAYHLDWHTDDDLHQESQDATRLGLRIERQSLAGWRGLLQVERWASRFDTETVLRPDPAYVARAGIGRTWFERSALHTETAVEVAFADHTSDAFDVGGRAALVYHGSSSGLELGAERTLRTPSLAETHGQFTQDFANGDIRRYMGSGELPFERQDRGFVEARALVVSASVAVTAEVWRLSQGIGWRAPDSGAAVLNSTGGLEVTVPQIAASVRRSWGGRSAGVSWWANGHRVLGDLEHRANRVAGWPLWSAASGLRLWHDLVNHNNQLFLDLRARGWGVRFDDALAAIDESQLPSLARLDLRAGLRIRDAEIYASLSNLTDEEQVEVLGTHRRFREFRLGLNWPFFN